MNQFIPFHSVKGFVGVGSQVRSQSTSYGTETTAVETPRSDNTFLPSFSDVLLQLEETHTEPPNKEIVETESNKHIEHDDVEIEEALVPFLNAEAHELAEHFDPEVLTSLILHVLSTTQDESLSNGTTKDPVTTPRSNVNQLELKPEASGMESTSNDQIKMVIGLENESIIPSLTDDSKIKDFSLEEKTQMNRQPTIYRMPVSVLQAYQFQDQQAIEDQTIERLLDVIKVSENVPRQVLLSQNAELVQQVEQQVETFFHSQDRTTLNQLITTIKEIVRPTASKTLDMEEVTPTELESSEELERLLLQLKGDKTLQKAMEDPLKTVLTESKVEKAETLNPNQAMAQHALNGSVKNESNKPSVLNESLVSPEKTVHASDRVLQQSEVLKAEGQSEERRFIKTLQRILQQGSMTQRSDGQTTLTLKLFPEHLGKLQIQVIQNGQKLAAQIIAESSATKDLVERSLPQLRQALHSQNVTFDQIDVEEFVNKDQQQQHEQEQRDQQEHQENEQNSRAETSFSFKSLLEGLFS
ncbi:flagellar hook-length control protein FliK [Alkalicoccobacillus gibsonii]|uniref:flagellar hook-length control protein FliK n=1 Tax=Alkalicoccobacillus gibsonii TaxID=79881 RepID=UPI0035187ACB